MVEVRPLEREAKPWAPTGPDDITRPIVLTPSHRDGLYLIDATDKQLEKWGKTAGYDLDRTVVAGEGGFYNGPVCTIKLENTVNRFFPETSVDDAIRVAILRADPLVANSKTEYQTGKWPGALFYIHSETEELEVKAKKIDIINRARKASFDMTKASKQAMVRVLLKKDPTNTSDSGLDVLVDEAVVQDPKIFVQYASMDKAKLATWSLLEEAIMYGKLTKKAGSILYGTESIGFDEAEAVEYLDDPVNQPLRIRLMEELKK